MRKKKISYIKKIEKINIYKLGTVLSIIAIILSQFRPLYSYFEKPNTQIRSDIGRFFVFHDFGTLKFQNWIQVKNDAYSTSETIKDIYLFLEKKDTSNFKTILKAQHELDYFQIVDNRPRFIPVFDIYLLPGQGLFGEFIFSEITSVENQKYLNNLKNEIYQDIYNKSNFGLNPLISQELQEKVDNLCNENLKFVTEGEYRYFFVLVNDKGKILKPKKYYEFKMFKSDIDALEEITIDYSKGGNGINYYIKNKNIGFYTSAIELYNSQIINEMFKEFKIVIKKTTANKL